MTAGTGRKTRESRMKAVGTGRGIRENRMKTAGTGRKPVRVG